MIAFLPMKFQYPVDFEDKEHLINNSKMSSY